MAINELHGKLCTVNGGGTDAVPDKPVNSQTMEANMTNTIDIPKKRGIAVYRKPAVTKGKMGAVTRMKFFIDREIPVFSSDSCTLFEERV